MAESAASRRKWALGELRRFGISGPEVYLIDLIPLLEMAWADGNTQPAEVDHLMEFLHEHVAHINEVAGHDVLTTQAAQRFLAGFLEERPCPDLLKTLRAFIAPVRLSNSDDELNERTRHCLLSACIDIAASAVSDYPFPPGGRFDGDEKRTYFEILETV
jgi:hypothetical protein